MLPEIEDRIKTVNRERKTSWHFRVHFGTLRRAADCGLRQTAQMQAAAYDSNANKRVLRTANCKAANRKFA